MRKPRFGPTTWASLLVYGTLTVAAFAEQFGKLTDDTKPELLVSPGRFMARAFTLWNPTVSLGELQNQAYGYLFPMGPFFWTGQAVHLPPWVVERVWAVVLIVAGAEGARRLALAMGLTAWPAWVAGLTYGLNPRVMSELGVRSAEVLPGIVLPWIVLPIVLALTGRLRHRQAAVLSVAAYLFTGAVNGTATIAPLPLVVIVIVWGIRRKLAPWALLGWWVGLIALASVWWAASLVKLNAYSPPFFDYVEDAKVTTSTTGFLDSLRGASNWVSFLTQGGFANWPAGYTFSFNPWMVAASGILAALGVLGLATFRSSWRAPLMVAAFLGLVCLTIGHASGLQSPVALLVQDLLDGPFALLRNVHKIDPVLRLPLAIGTGALFGRVLVGAGSRRALWRPLAARAGALALVGLVLAMGQPAFALNLRTPGWSRIPAYWTQAADYVAGQPNHGTTWVIPGSGFAVQNWGRTDDEPMSAVARSPWVTRSQVPLAPAETIRMLSRMEDLLSTGSGSPQLGEMLARIGVGYLLVRHDLETSQTESTSSSLVSIALARSRGVARVRIFGALDFGPAIELFKVTARPPAPAVQVRAATDAVTVASGPYDVLNAVGQGLLGSAEPAIVQGDSGWDRMAEIIGDAFRKTERQFGRVQQAEGPVLALNEPHRGRRLVPNYPGNADSKPVYASYAGLRYVDASSSQGWTDALGAVLPEMAPFSAVDGDLGTGWVSGYFRRGQGQWIEVKYAARHAFTRVVVHTTGTNPRFNEITRLRVQAGSVTRTVKVDPFRATATAYLGGASADDLRITVVGTSHPRADQPVSLLEVDAAGLPAERTLVMPNRAVGKGSDYLLSARPPTRACIPTLLAPDCQPDRQRASDESRGIDRSLWVAKAGVWRLRGTAVANPSPAGAALLYPLAPRVVVRGSSFLDDDPTVSPRMTYDGQPNTSWIADPQDDHPKLVIDWATPHDVSRIFVAQPAAPAVAPTRAVLRAGGQVRRVELGEFGTFRPLHVRHLQITFTNATRNGAPIGIGELYLKPDSAYQPLNGAARTGAVCGFGPEVRIDGRKYQTRVSGLMGDVISSGPLNLLPCDGPVRMSRGRHHVQILANAQFQPVEVRLVGHQNPPLSHERSLRIRSTSATKQVADLGAGAAAILSTTGNFNAGWRARVGDRTLAPQRVDGWAQGWRVPAGAGGRLVIDYAPQPSYRFDLVGGLVLAGLIMVGAAVVLARTAKGSAGVQPPRVEPRRRRRITLVVGAALALPLAWVLLGIPGLVATVLAVVGGRHPRLLLGLAATLMLAGVVVACVELVGAPRFIGAPAQGLVGMGAVLALSQPLTRRGPA